MMFIQTEFTYVGVMHNSGKQIFAFVNWTLRLKSKLSREVSRTIRSTKRCTVQIASRNFDFGLL